MFVTEALATVVPDVLPGDVVVRASLRNQMESRQREATLVLELKSSEYRDQIIKRANKWYADATIPKTKKYKFYITELPQRTHKRSMSYSDEEVEPKPASRPAADKKKKDRKTSKYDEKRDHKRKRHGSPKPSTSKMAYHKPGTPKKAHESPKPVTSTPVPSAPKIDPNASIDTLEKLVQSVTKKVPVA